MAESPPTDVAEAAGSFRFTRKIQVRQYEVAEASITIPFPFVGNADEDLLNAREAAFLAKSAIFEQLGIEFRIDDKGVLRELIERQLGPTTEVKSDGRQTSSERPQRSRSNETDDVPSCPECNGPMWDNRPKKESGQFSKRSPDFKCRDKSCEKGVWLESKENNR